MFLSYAGGFTETVEELADFEKAGLDIVFVPEAYSFDAVSQLGFIAARTAAAAASPRGSSSSTRARPSLTAMTAAGLDYVSGGRFMLGIGASGPQVIEGWHGVPLRRPDRPHPRGRRDLPAGLAPRAVCPPRQVLHASCPRSGDRPGQATQADQSPGARADPDRDRRHRPQERRHRRRARRGLDADLLPAGEGRGRVGRRSLAEGTAKRDPELGELDVIARPRWRSATTSAPLRDLGRPSWRSTSAGWGRKRQELLQRPGLPVRLRGRGQDDPGRLPGRPQGRGRGGWFPPSWSSSTR